MRFAGGCLSVRPQEAGPPCLPRLKTPTLCLRWREGELPPEGVSSPRLCPSQSAALGGSPTPSRSPHAQWQRLLPGRCEGCCWARDRGSINAGASIGVVQVKHAWAPGPFGGPRSPGHPWPLGAPCGSPALPGPLPEIRVLQLWVPGDPGTPGIEIRCSGSSDPEGCSLHPRSSHPRRHKHRPLERWAWGAVRWVRLWLRTAPGPSLPTVCSRNSCQRGCSSP